ncbi:MAG: hypothetical protein ACKVQV_12865 [Bacteroidia bacterium]
MGDWRIGESENRRIGATIAKGMKIGDKRGGNGGGRIGDGRIGDGRIGDGRIGDGRIGDGRGKR